MTTSSSVCVDASLLVKLAVPEEDSDKAENVWRTWQNDQVKVYAPGLVLYEFVSVIRKRVRRELMTIEEAEFSIDQLLALPLSLVNSVDLHKTAYRVAVELDIASVYDAHYVALAMAMDCELWTADEKLYNMARERFPLVRWLGAA